MYRGDRIAFLSRRSAYCSVINNRGGSAVWTGCSTAIIDRSTATGIVTSTALLICFRYALPRAPLGFILYADRCGGSALPSALIRWLPSLMMQLAASKAPSPAPSPPPSPAPAPSAITFFCPPLSIRCVRGALREPGASTLMSPAAASAAAAAALTAPTARAPSIRLLRPMNSGGGPRVKIYQTPDASPYQVASVVELQRRLESPKYRQAIRVRGSTEGSPRDPAEWRDQLWNTP